MPRYFFDLCEADGWLTDAEGSELADVAAVRAEVLMMVRSLMASDITEHGGLNLGHFLSVRDDEGREVHRLHFRDAIAVRDGPAEG